MFAAVGFGMPYILVPRVETVIPKFRGRVGHGTITGDWSDYDIYVAAWWNPVLTQLKTKTYFLNITAVSGGASYKIDFYLASQAGEKNEDSGRYPFSGSPLETFLVANPSGDDSLIDKMRITSNEAVYNVAYAKWGDGTGATWTYSLKDATSGAILLSDTTQVTNAILTSGSFSQPFKVKEDQKFDGEVSLSRTSYYWNFSANPDSVKEIDESTGDGIRSSEYTYHWEPDSNGLSLPKRLLSITQSGGAHPYVATYDDNELLTDYVCVSSSTHFDYGTAVVRTDSFNNHIVRTGTTTYSNGMAQASIAVAGAADVTGQTVLYSGSDGTNPGHLS